MATATFYQLLTSKTTQIKRNLSLLMSIIILCSCSNDEWGNGNLVPPSGTAPEVISIVVKNQQGQNLLEPDSEGSLANAKAVVSFCDKDFQVAETIPHQAISFKCDYTKHYDFYGAFYIDDTRYGKAIRIGMVNFWKSMPPLKINIDIGHINYNFTIVENGNRTDFIYKKLTGDTDIVINTYVDKVKNITEYSFME